MSKLWELEPVTIMQLTAELKEETGWDKSTVITLLKRMEAKKAVSYVKEERAKKYYFTLKREDAELAETKSFLKRIYHESIGLMVNSLISQKAISEENLHGESFHWYKWMMIIWIVGMFSLFFWFLTVNCIFYLRLRRYRVKATIKCIFCLYSIRNF